jgi:putative radical SAM enzyme (TIGR03279 family)
MSAPRVVAVAPGSPAAVVGLQVGDELVSFNGQVPRDVIEYQLFTDAPEVQVEVDRGGLRFDLEIEKAPGVPLGVEVHTALFDQVRTCDNHCSFCFIYQLPPGLRKSLYLKDDDYRLSFLYGNFTTLTRFTEIDLERIISERLSPLYVSIHATDPDVRAEMLRNRRGAMSLRWLGALLDEGIEVHGQIVVCPGTNDGAVLDDTLAGVLDRFPDLATLCVVPLGISQFSTEADLRPHTPEEAGAVIDCVEDWQDVYRTVLGRRLAFLADEYYLLAGRPFPAAEAYEGFPMHEDGVGMARTFEAEFLGRTDSPTRPASGFFSWVDGAPAEGYRASRETPGSVSVALSPRRHRKPHTRVGVLTGTYGARVLAPMLESEFGPAVRPVEVTNEFFGGNIGVAGLMVGEDVSRALSAEPEYDHYLLPDVCLSGGLFLDGTAPTDLPREVEIIPTDGISLHKALHRLVGAAA